MAELFPVDKETLSNYIKRSDIGATALIQSSMHKHIYGGRKPWPSHTSSRYCPVCNLCQALETLRQIIIQLPQEIQEKALFNITEPEPNQPYDFISFTIQY